VTTDSTNAYETHAEKFLQLRDHSVVGVQVVNRWARAREPGSHVIEIACGGGIPITRSLVDSGLAVWAIDSSQTLIRAFQQRFPDIPTDCSTVLDSDYFARKFDAAVSVGLIFLLEANDQRKMLCRVSEILNPQASFLFSAPLESGTWTDINTGLFCTSLGLDGYRSALELAGFSITRCHVDSGKNNYFEVEKVNN